jgi:DNA-binding winged helix-turn-helix (wHTH) protein
VASDSFRFDQFELDAGNRLLRHDGRTVEVNGRYFDALALLVREAGRLVTKDRFMDEVWRGVPVTDEALTQCIRSIRRQLGDDATRPRFIETVPKHGYRFIAPVAVEPGAAGVELPPARGGNQWFTLALAGTAGGGIAGLAGGLFYGFAAAQPGGAATGAVSALLVLVCISVAVALIGAAGVSFGIAAARRQFGPITPAMIAGGAIGGVVVGAVVKLIGLDAFALLFGRSPDAITGAPEGLLIGLAVGAGAWLAERRFGGSVQRGIGTAALIGAATGAAVALLGGRMMAGSLDSLARTFPASRLRLDGLGTLFGERGLGRVTQVVTGALEGALFCACVVGAMLLAARRSAPGA